MDFDEALEGVLRVAGPEVQALARAGAELFAEGDERNGWDFLDSAIGALPPPDDFDEPAWLRGDVEGADDDVRLHLRSLRLERDHRKRAFMHLDLGSGGLPRGERSVGHIRLARSWLASVRDTEPVWWAEATRLLAFEELSVEWAREAVAAFEELDDVHPSDVAEAYATLGALLRHEEPIEALACLQVAVSDVRGGEDVRSTLPDSLVAIGGILLDLDAPGYGGGREAQLQVAVDSLEEAIGIYDDNKDRARAQRLLARALAEQGEDERAAALLASVDGSDGSDGSDSSDESSSEEEEEDEEEEEEEEEQGLEVVDLVARLQSQLSRHSRADWDAAHARLVAALELPDVLESYDGPGADLLRLGTARGRGGIPHLQAALEQLEGDAWATAQLTLGLAIRFDDPQLAVPHFAAVLESDVWREAPARGLAVCWALATTLMLTEVPTVRQRAWMAATGGLRRLDALRDGDGRVSDALLREVEVLYDIAAVTGSA